MYLKTKDIQYGQWHVFISFAYNRIGFLDQPAE